MRFIHSEQQKRFLVKHNKAKGDDLPQSLPTDRCSSASSLHKAIGMGVRWWNFCKFCYGLWFKKFKHKRNQFSVSLFVSVPSPFNAIKIVPFSISFHLSMSTFSVLPLSQAYNYPVVLINTRTQSKTSKHLFSSSPVKLKLFQVSKVNYHANINHCAALWFSITQ